MRVSLLYFIVFVAFPTKVIAHCYTCSYSYLRVQNNSAYALKVQNFQNHHADDFGPYTVRARSAFTQHQERIDFFKDEGTGASQCFIVGYRFIDGYGTKYDLKLANYLCLLDSGYLIYAKNSEFQVWVPSNQAIVFSVDYLNGYFYDRTFPFVDSWWHLDWGITFNSA